MLARPALASVSLRSTSSRCALVRVKCSTRLYKRPANGLDSNGADSDTHTLRTASDWMKGVSSEIACAVVTHLPGLAVQA
eukprot:scaffold209373_cov37-Tisochrysis_lutea.AAC.2